MMDAVAHAKAKKDAPSVAFAKFLDLRSAAPDVPIAAVEGREDVGVWKVWFVRCGFDDHIELLPCSGKKKVFKLREILKRNKKNRADNVIYIVDRDYDDWAGHPPEDDIFMTDRYAIENYFVCSRVLDHVLNNNFSCAGNPAEKKPIHDMFHISFEQYREASRETQVRTYVLRRLGHNDQKPLPAKIKDIAKIEAPYQTGELDPDRVKVSLVEDEGSNVIESLVHEYNELPFLERARGKYHKAFLLFFYQSLQDERDQEKRQLFPSTKPPANFKFSALNFVEWAGVSQMPEGLREFIEDTLGAGSET